MEKREFHTIGELESVKGQLATATQRPIYVGHHDEYQRPEGDEPMIAERQAGEVAELRNRSALWNDRDQQPEYISSDEYELVQHRDVLDMVQDTVDRTLGDIDMGVIRDYGAKIDGTLVFSNLDEASIDVSEVVDTDGYIPPEGDVDPFGGSRARDTVGLGMRIGNSFDGSKQVQASTMGYRFICQNWMVWGEEEIASTQSAHIGDIDEEFFESVIEEVFEVRQEVSDTIGKSEREEIPFEWVPDVLQNAGFGTNYAKRITGRVLRQETQRRGETTAWRLYNAATSELDNRRSEEITKHSYDRHQDNAWNLLGEPSSPSETLNMEEVEEFAIID